MAENVRKVTQDKQSFDLKTAAELDDLYRTKINLEERLVELIRYISLFVYCMYSMTFESLNINFFCFDLFTYQYLL